MNYNFKFTVLILVLILLESGSFAQVEITILNNSNDAKQEKAIFFTNRPLVVNEDNTYTFQNKFTDRSNTLYFCSYNFDKDSIAVLYRPINLSDKYPTTKVQHNILYDIYKYHRLERGIKNFFIIVPGYGKSFNQQVNTYMRRLKSEYGDSLFNKALISVFAWGDEANAPRYYRAVRKAKNGSADFAIFQHMLDEFISDSVFFNANPKDFQITIAFSSMGNKLFLEYLKNRKKQGIPIIKTYQRIAFIGSVAPPNSFNKGKPFHDLYQMTDRVHVFVNAKDILLKASSIAHLRKRLGNRGPKHEKDLPDYIAVDHIEQIITVKDMMHVGHDYLLTNPVLIERILRGIHENPVEDR